ncbi:VOC family protein [Ruania zhangjianzhongii]|uniref:VOC family protein n=1 Tax=Ruania zhangjianzhongii TaxID=2603206 RepID=UPI0011CB78BB|nr:VOC family protein [Ruania zhangjianzhongii]
MFTGISIHSVYVHDQQQALDFYVGTLGFEVSADVDMGFMRWLTVAVPAQPDRQILLEVPAAPMMPEATAATLRELVTQGAMGVAAILTTDDCRATYAALRAKGVEFIEEPTEQPYGIDCALRDPFGNHIRITQPMAMTEVTQDDLDRWAAARPQ